jgi:signal transduction histidine kinase
MAAMLNRLSRWASNWLISGRTHFESYGISPIGLSFTRPAQEAEYQTFIFQDTITHTRLALVLATIIMASYGILDTLIYDDHNSLMYALEIRFFVLVPSILLLFLSTFHSRYSAFARFAGAGALCIISFGFFLTTYRSNVLTLVYTFPGIVVATAYAFFFPGWAFRHAFIAGALANAIYSLAFWTIDIPVPTRSSVGIAMTTIFLLFAVVAYQKELISRQLFVKEMRERETLTRQTQKDAQYLAWLRQLAYFLSHEMRRPVTQIKSSIENAQNLCKHDGQVTTFLERASSGTQHVNILIERATTATNAETFVREGQPQWIALQSLVAEQLDAHRRITSGIFLRLKCRAPLNVYADLTQLKQAIDNLLANATSFADEASTVEIAVEVESGHAAIKVRNKGPRIKGNPEELFGPFASTRSGPASEHRGLGLYLVRLIAEHHGGTASIGNLDDASGVEASILLPLKT